MNFAVVGAGAWGTAFALHLARTGCAVTLIPRRPEHATALAALRENTDYLPGAALPPELRIDSDLAAGLAGAEVVFLACPAQSIRDTCARIRAAGGARRLVCLAKGLERGTHLRASQVIASALPDAQTGSLSGPTNAAEVARGLPAAMVLASAPPALAEEVQAAISNGNLRVYTSDDVAGVEYGGALKNIYAIAAGCCDGLGLGDNARAALLTRALTEMVRVGAALGARPETFYGLSGFGDLVATCHGGWSRNREFGHMVGEGARAADLIARRKTVVEGYETTESFAGLCGEKRIDAPILREIHAVLFAGRRPADALAALMSRGLKQETVAACLPS
ncbi:MAG TPA: NAD(P)H-dependent glycerol-3-phosphate dehydrogenase [Opitutaceae bacterium]|jgi:glycerol-3-phosphate dehydrogenase (NAD(P)+)|nr:NAD(P)H-dependent glycerol-3-phosphate dehydrogenase [Opitutaceae bacterium]